MAVSGSSTSANCGGCGASAAGSGCHDCLIGLLRTQGRPAGGGGVAPPLIQVASPHVAFLGRIPGTRRYSDLERHTDNERISGVVVFRTETALLYFNVDNVLHDVLVRVHQEGPDVSLVVCDLSTSPYVDLAGASMLLKLQTELLKRGIRLGIAEARASVRDLLRAEGFEEKPVGQSLHLGSGPHRKLPATKKLRG